MANQEGEVITLDPRDDSALQSDGVAARPASLDGKVVGLLSNNKPNSELLLRDVVELLKEKYSIKEVIEANKGTHRIPAPEDIVDDLVSRCDVVITSTAEWGSCTSCSMQDAVAFEKRGIPSAVLVTRPFNSQAKAMANLLGLPNYGYAVIGHPMGSLNDEQVMDRAKEALPQVETQLTS